MVRCEPETLRGTQSRRTIKTRGNQTVPDRSRLWSSTTTASNTLKASAVHTGSVEDHSAARRYFEALAPSHRRRYLAWIESAKREETKLRRLKEAIRLLASGKVLGLK
jgi:hypothetical protein